MASIRNFVATDQGVNWALSFEYSNDQQQTWTAWAGQLPRDLDDIAADRQDDVLLNLSLAIAADQGHDV